MADFLTKLALIGAAVSFAACLVAANRRRIALVHDAARRILSRSAVESALLTVFVLGFVQYAATKGTNGNDRAENGTAGCKSADGELHVRDIAGETTNLCFTTIYASTNSVFLSLAWPTNLFADGACLDFFAKARSLTNRWEWIGCHMVAAGETNLEVEVSCQQFAPSSTNMPAAAFFLVADRETSATTMGDADGDGIPDVYELHNGTNPYVPDSEDVDRLTVGADCDYPTVSAALAASTNYSVVALSAGEHVLSGSLVMPGHPVMLTGPEVGYAVLHSDADIGAVMLVDGQDEKTLFRNLYVVLEARRNFQAGFWVGGNLPWSGVGASPTFENVRVRAPHPGVLYYGWHYYRDDGGRSLLTDCTMNAAGAENAIGVYSKGGPVVEMEGCHFTNFMQTNGNFATYFDEGVFSPTNVVSEWAGSSPGLSWAG